MILGIFALVIISLCKGPDPFYTLVKHSLDSKARCLDGSQAALYYSIGSDEKKNYIMIYFNSGGLCTGKDITQTLESCYQRTNGDLGSSKTMKSNRTFYGQGLLSSKPQQNPVFYDWTRVYITYCDGSQYQGSRENPIPYKDKQLYFRGADNMIEHFRYLNQTLGLYSADKVVLTGVSAGGIATFFWSNYVYQRSINKQVLAMPDSGLFIVEYINPWLGIAPVVYQTKGLLSILGNTTFSMPQCLTQFSHDMVNCFNAANLVKYYKSPFFIIESQYDQWSVQNILLLQCANKKTPGEMTTCNESEHQALQDYRTATLQALKKFSSLTTLGIWSPTCVQHGFSDTSLSFNSEKYKIPSTTGIKLSQAMARFIQNPYSGNHNYVDTEAWPGNAGCSGIASKSYKNLMVQ